MPDPRPAPSIHVRDLRKVYTVPEREGGVRAAATSLFKRRTKSVEAVAGISFDVQPGELVGLVGPSGGGKSTVVSLIARFYDVSGGSIRIDGVNVRDLDSGHYREQLGMVLQDPYLFHGTVLDNIRYGLPSASLGTVVEAAKAANAHDFVTALEHGYDTPVGDRGGRLSGGQRQRIAIARAILKDPPILLLDEATSALDNESERLVQEALERLMQGRTTLIIAHRLSTIRAARRIAVLDDGWLVELGSHDELLARDGLNARLWRLQFAEDRAAAAEAELDLPLLAGADALG